MAVAENFVEPPDIAAPPHEQSELKLPVGVKLVYAFGQAIESGYLVVAGFVFFYYTAVLGLSGSVVGTALGLSMCLDALIDPLIGSISDNLRTRLGRRLLLMLIGAPLTGLALWMLFSPPLGLQPFLLFGWLVMSKMSLRGVASLYNLPYAALGAEMASGYTERASVAAYRGFFGVAISLVMVILAYSVVFAGQGGLQVRAHYPMFGRGMGLLLFVCGAICLVGVWRFAKRLPQPTTPLSARCCRACPASCLEVFPEQLLPRPLRLGAAVLDPRRDQRRTEQSRLHLRLEVAASADPVRLDVLLYLDHGGRAVRAPRDCPRREADGMHAGPGRGDGLDDGDPWSAGAGGHRAHGRRAAMWMC